MIKNLKVFKSLFGNSNMIIPVYTGTIHVVYADEFGLNDKLYKRKDCIVKKDAEFYQVSLGFKSIEYPKIIAGREKAYEISDMCVQGREVSLLLALTDQLNNPSEKNRILNSVKDNSRLFYFEPSELEYSHSISYNDYEDLVKPKVKRK